MHIMQLTRGLQLTRRSALLGLGSAVSLAGVAGRASLALAAAPTEQRFVVVLLRGAMDGLSVVVPYGDPALHALRGELVPKLPGQPDGLRDLGGFYGLHPALANLHTMYQANELLAVHAAAGPYRSRSHFEAQDYLESGADHRLTSGWLNRAVAALPPAPASPAGHTQADGQAQAMGQTPAVGRALAMGVTVPLLLRGSATVASWAPHGFASPAPELYARIAQLNRDDRLIGPAITQGLHARGFATEVMADDAMNQNAGNQNVGTQNGGNQTAGSRARYAFPALAEAAGQLLAAPNGPRIAAMEVGGWDTHVAQMARLEAPLRELDAGLAALKAALAGPAWQRTVVLVVTEFGRTARVNGDNGTDHGTATVAFVLGGAVAGGRVRADWPGLGAGNLFENRDLVPTIDVRAVAKGLLAGHLGLSGDALARVFPGSESALPTNGLLRA
jgi:uncharacterized protein (DUF1501 family)